MNKRRYLVLGIGAWTVVFPFTIFAQPTPKIARIGFFHQRPRADNEFFQAFVSGMQSMGYIEGKTFFVEYLVGGIDQWPKLAENLVRRQVDVILAPTPQAALAAKKVAGTIPIVFAVVGDPVKTGLAASLARPGGNATGLTAFGSDLGGKRLELLREISPRIKRVAAIWNPTVPDKVIEWDDTRQAAKVLSLDLLSLEVRSTADFEAAFESARRSRAEAIIVFGEPMVFGSFTRIVEFSRAARIPTIYPWRESVEAGGLICLGPSISDNYRRAATYVDKILKGAKPGDLPIEQPTRLELIINARTAATLGIRIPQSVLLRADQVIE